MGSPVHGRIRILVPLASRALADRRTKALQPRARTPWLCQARSRAVVPLVAMLDLSSSNISTAWQCAVAAVNSGAIPSPLAPRVFPGLALA